MIKISCIISTYNRATQLKRAIQSVLNQSFQDFEVIVVDDHSNDHTKNMMEKLVKKDNRVRYIRLKKNCGFDSHPKNIGIQEARGEYVSFLDDDDVYRKDALKILYKYAYHTQADVVYGDYIYYHKGKTGFGWSLDFNLNLLKKQNYISMSVVMAKKSKVAEVGGFDETVPKFKDWNLWLRLAKNACSFLHVSIPITEVYMSDNTISTKYKVEYDKEGNYLPTFFDPADCPIYATKTCLGKEKELKVAIITMTLDREEYTKTCFEQLQKTAGYPFHHFILDQNSKEKTFLKQYEKLSNVSVVYSDSNVGIATGWIQLVNTARNAGDFDIVIKVDNDCYPISQDWLKELVELFRRNRQMILSPYVEGLDSLPGGVLRHRDGGMPYVLLNDKVLGIVPNLGGLCFASHISLYDNFEFPENLPGNKDLYLSLYAKQNGFGLFYVEELRCEHYEGTAGQHQRYPDYFKQLYG